MVTAIQINNLCTNFCTQFRDESCDQYEEMQRVSAIEILGDDEHLENHISPNCLVLDD